VIQSLRREKLEVKAVLQRPLEFAVIEEDVSDYFYRFKQFCSFYPLRERHLADSILHAVDDLLKPNSNFLSILDVGSADGELLGEVIGTLRARSVIRLRSVAVEPDPLAFGRLEGTAGLIREPETILTSCVQAKIEELINCQQPTQLDKFDLILCSHVFYHFKNWSAIAMALLSLLKPGGCIVVILDSHNSPIYQFKKTLETIISDHLTTQNYGDLTFAEVFLEFLNSSGIQYSYRELDWKLSLTPIRLIQDFGDMLTFLYRFRVNGTRKVQRALEQFSVKFQSGDAYSFPWKEGLFVLSE
jgi:SAM-dependent methyltransferase